MAKKKAAKKSASKSSGGAKKAPRKAAKKKSGGRSKSVMGRMSDMMESAGEGIAAAAKYVTPKGMMGKRGAKKSASRKKK